MIAGGKGVSFLIQQTTHRQSRRLAEFRRGKGVRTESVKVLTRPSFRVCYLGGTSGRTRPPHIRFGDSQPSGSLGIRGTAELKGWTLRRGPEPRLWEEIFPTVMQEAPLWYPQRTIGMPTRQAFRTRKRAAEHRWDRWEVSPAGGLDWRQTGAYSQLPRSQENSFRLISDGADLGWPDRICRLQ